MGSLLVLVCGGLGFGDHLVLEELAERPFVEALGLEWVLEVDQVH